MEQLRHVLQATLDLHLIQRLQLDGRTWVNWRRQIEAEIATFVDILATEVLLVELFPGVHVRLLLQGSTLEGIVLYEQTTCYRIVSIYNHQIVHSTMHTIHQIKDLLPYPMQIKQTALTSR